MAMSKEKQKNKVHPPLRHGARNFQPTPLTLFRFGQDSQNEFTSRVASKQEIKGGWKPHQVSMASAHVVLDNPARKRKKKIRGKWHASARVVQKASHKELFLRTHNKSGTGKKKCSCSLRAPTGSKDPTLASNLIIGPLLQVHITAEEKPALPSERHRPACGTRCAAQCWLRLSHIVSKT